jgi:hypothetical protein
MTILLVYVNVRSHASKKGVDNYQTTKTQSKSHRV